MKMTVVNKKMEIGDIRLKSVGPSSVFLIGDSETITCSYSFDTPPDSLIIDPKVPIRSNES